MAFFLPLWDIHRKMVAKIELRDYRVERADDVLSFGVQVPEIHS